MSTKQLYVCVCVVRILKKEPRFLCPTEEVTTVLRVDTKLFTVFMYVHLGCYICASSIPSKLKCIYVAINIMLKLYISICMITCFLLLKQKQKL